MPVIRGANYYNVNDYGKWEGENYHLIRSVPDDEFCEDSQLAVADFIQKKQAWKEILFQHRESRPRPRLDDKILCSWNALMLKGYADAYAAFQDPAFLDMASTCAQFMLTSVMQEDGGLYRNHKAGRSTIDAYLEDYATLAEALITLYEVTLEEKWLRTAKQLTDYSYDHFYDEKSRMFFFTSDREKNLISRKVETDDNVIPSSNAIMANNLMKLGHYYDNKYYSKSSETMLNNVSETSVQYAAGASKWLQLYANHVGEFYEVAIAGPEAVKIVREINAEYIPNKLIVGSSKESSLPLLAYKFDEKVTTIYVCIDGACKLPVRETERALEKVKIAF